jgi:hypothetical protein
MPTFIHEAAYAELAERGLTAFTNPSAPALGEFFVRLDSRWTGNPFERGFQELVPSSRAAARPGSLSSFTGAGAQPMHTDAAYIASPPRYLVFECVDPGEVPCRTEAWVTNQARLLEERPSLLTDPKWVFLQTATVADLIRLVFRLDLFNLSISQRHDVLGLFGNVPTL